MPYSHHHKDSSPNNKVTSFLAWKEDNGEQFHGDFVSGARLWTVHYNQILELEINFSSVDFLNTFPPACKISKEERKEKFDKSCNEWVSCPIFWRITISATVKIPSEVEGVKIAPTDSNTKLLRRLFWEILKGMTPSKLSPEESKQNQRCWFEKTCTKPNTVCASIPETSWFAYWEAYGGGQLFWFNTETAEGACEPVDESEYSILDACGYVPSAVSENVVADLVIAFFQ